jgi:hypothetical protein
MKLSLEVNMDNAAFEGEGFHNEAARILREAAAHLETFGDDFAGCYDLNGNKVGKWKIDEEQEITV